MTDKNELIESQPLPSFLSEAVQSGVSTGLEDMRTYLTPPRLKIMQKTRKEPFKAFEEGMVIITPTNEVVCGLNGVFAFTVLYAYDQFCVHNPYKRPDGEFLIRDSSFDFNSEIAQKCRAFVKEPWPDGGEYGDISYCTHVNALIVIHGIPALKDVPIMLNQYMGELRSGKRMLDLLASRTSNGTPIYAHNLMAKSATHKQRKGDDTWVGLDFSNPTADIDCGPFVTEAQFNRYKVLHEQCKTDKERYAPTPEDELVGDGAVDKDTL